MVELAANTGWLWDTAKMAEAVRTREDALAAAREVGLPAVLKPADSAGQRGLSLVRSSTELETLLEAALVESAYAWRRLVASLALSTSYTVTASGTKDLTGNVMAPVTWSFTTKTTADCCSVWTLTDVPPNPSENDTSGVELIRPLRAASPLGRVAEMSWKGSGAETFQQVQPSCPGAV